MHLTTGQDLLYLHNVVNSCEVHTDQKMPRPRPKYQLEPGLSRGIKRRFDPTDINPLEVIV